MKFFRSTIILLILVVIAGTAYWFFELKRGKEKKKEKEKASLLFEHGDREIVKLSLKERDKDPIVIEKKEIESREEGEGEKEEEWLISSPVKTIGDRYTIDAILNSLKEAKREEIVQENLEKEAEYGLNNPEFSLRFYYKDDETAQGIDFGIENLTRSKVFIKVLGKDKIISVSTELRNSINKSLFDVRDKRISPFKAEEVVGVSLITPNGAFKLERNNEEWYFQPDNIKASKERVDAYTGNLRWGSFTQVMEEKLKDFKKYGLDKPRLILKFDIIDGQVFLFVLGDLIKEGDAEFFYATRSMDNMVFQVTSDTVSRLLATEFELKDRRIFNFSMDDVSSVTLEKGDKSFSLVKKDDEWKLTDSDKELRSGYKIDSIVRSISEAEYEEREPITKVSKDYGSTGIDFPKYSVTLNFKDERKPLTVKLTEKDENTNKLYLTPDNGETVYYTSGYFVSNFPEKREELLE